MESPPGTPAVVPDGAGDAAPPAPDGPVTLRVSSWSLARAVLVVVVGLVVLRAMVAADTMLWWLAIATALAGALTPAVAWLRRWMPGWAAILAVLALGLAFLGLVGYRGAAELANEFEALQSRAVQGAEEIQSSERFGQVATEFGLVAKTEDFFAEIPLAVSGAGVEGGAAGAVQSAASSGSALFAIATFAVLMLIFGPRFVHAGLDQIDDPFVRRRVSALVIRSYHASSRYVWLMAARAVVVGVLAGVACALLGFQTPTALGVAFAVMSLIPGLGIVLAATPIALYVAVGSVSKALVFVGLAVVLQALEASHVQRRIDEASVHVGPTPTLVAAFMGLQLYGFGGLLVGLATAVYGLAVLQRLTRVHDEVFTAVRQLVGEEPTVVTSGDVVATDGATVTAEAGADVVVAPGADVIIGSGPADRGAPSAAPADVPDPGDRAGSDGP
jgi:predicted PurR-regulated permease PerM